MAAKKSILTEPCALCAKTKFSYSHPCEWNQIQQNFITTKCTGITTIMESAWVQEWKVANTTAITQLLKLKQHGAITLFTNHYNIVYCSLPQKILFTHGGSKMQNML